MNDNQSGLVSLDPAFAARIHTFKGDFIELWWACDSEMPSLGRIYNRREQAANERILERTVNKLLDEAKNPPASYEEQAARQARAAAALSGLAELIFELDKNQVQSLRDFGFAERIVEFAQMARQFDPALGEEQIFQASRNVWSMHLMQLLFGLPMENTPAVFAYSMLYPYTDNYFDDPAVPQAIKQAFVRRLGERLQGKLLRPANFKEQSIFELIHMVEEEYDRVRDRQVFDSLQAIYLAQCKSIQLLRQTASPYEVDVLGICLEKGGTSTLADGYLVAGDLTFDQARLAYFYGTLTQLFDDLEDVQQDTKDGILTVYSQTAQHWPLDAVTNRTIHFAELFLQELRSFEAPDLTPLMEAMERCLPALIVFSAGRGRRYYSRAYRREIQRHFPFRFAFLEKQINKLTRLGVSNLAVTEAFAYPASPLKRSSPTYRGPHPSPRAVAET